MIGTLLSGRYRLDERIGSGGMSTVYKAFDDTLERWVAIKVLHHSLEEDDLQLERFRREARTVARLSHPHVVTVIDAGEDEGHPFIVFEYVPGETLKQLIKRGGALPVTEAVAYAIEIGRALSAAHTERLVHRDVKPQNVLIDADGRAKVTDFGIARSLEADGLTATGRVLGTTDYVSPEQALGEDVTEQSDVYSLGICLYEMLTGRVPFAADSQVAVAMKHVREPLPDLRAARPEVSAALAAIVDRATCKERRNRYASVADFVRDLEQALGIEAARAGSYNGQATSVLQALPAEAAGPAARKVAGARRQPRLRTALGALVLLVAAAGVAAFLVFGRPADHAKPKAAALAPPHPVKLMLAKDFDPFGGDGEHPQDVHKAIDSDPSSFWQTSTYAGGQLGKPGVGLYVTARSPTYGRELRLTSPTPGFDVSVYGSNTLPPQIAGWGKPIGRATIEGQTSVRLHAPAGARYRSYLIWITKLPQQDYAAISSVELVGS